MIRKLLAGMGAIIVFSAIALADDFAPVGGSGDRQDVDRCPAGKYLKGVQYRSGLWLDRIKVYCATMDNNGRTSMAKSPFSGRGGSGGGEPVNAICPVDMVVFGAAFTLTPNKQVQRLILYCSDIRAKANNPIEFGGAPRGAWIRQSCGPSGNRQAATGLVINSGKYVGAIGVLCGPLPALNPTAGNAPIITGKKKGEAGQKSTTMICVEHAMKMASLYKELKSLGCESSSFNQTSDYWMKKCMKSQSGALQVNQPMLEQRVEKCKSGNAGGNDGDAGGAGGVAKVLADNTVYKNNSGDDSAANTVCQIQKGDTGKVLTTGPLQWVKLGSISGDCGGKSGWVWNDGELRLP